MDVFIPDGSTRITLAMVRSLGRRGLKVACGDSRLLTMAPFSKYCMKSVRYPSPERSVEKYHRWLIRFLKENNVKVYIPVLDATTKHAVLNQEEISRYSNVFLPERDSYLSMLQKHRSNEIARDLGLNVPEFIAVHSKKDLSRVKELQYPVIIKAAESAGAKGNRICHDFKEVTKYYRTLKSKYDQIMIAEYFPPGGDAIGVSCLMGEEGKVHNLFCHRRLKQYPPEGGQSVICESYHHPEAMDMAIKLLKHTGYKGIALVEFKVNPENGKLYFLEVNTRFWGSLQLPISSGMDFASQMYDLAVGNKVERLEYRKGVRCRWYAGEFLYLLRAHDKLKQLRDIFRIRMPNTFNMDLDRDDIVPSVMRIISTVYVFEPRIFKQTFLPKAKKVKIRPHRNPRKSTNPVGVLK